MAKTAMLSSNMGPNNLAAGSTKYITVGQNACYDNSVESAEQIICVSVGTFSKMWCRITANDRGASTLTFRINAADGTQTISIGDSQTGDFEDAVNTDAISSGDKVTYKLVVGSGGSTFNVTLISNIFAASSNTLEWLIANFGDALSTASSTQFQAVCGCNSARTATEANKQFKFKTSGTLKNMYINVEGNTRGTTTTFGSRIGEVNGNLLISIASGQTGFFQDTSNSDTVSVNNLVNYFVTTGTGTGTISWATWGTEFETTNNTYQTVAEGNILIGTGLTRYLPISGIAVLASTESHSQWKLGLASTLSKMGAYISANTITAATTIKLRVNGADGNQSVSIGSGQTGQFDDTSNTDTVDTDDLINFQLVSGGSGTSLTLRLAGVLIETAVTTSGRVSASGRQNASNRQSATGRALASGRVGI